MIARARKRGRERKKREHHTVLVVFSRVVDGSCGSSVGGRARSRWEEKKGDIDRDRTD